MMVVCIKQHLSNIWISIDKKKLSNIEAELKKSVAYKKSVYRKYLYGQLYNNI